ncbi:MAG: hypothetical protein H7287_11090 [Thermoleophilia bacterium]|nr:hypothetical protein [Thermoleophilia bacterium]
MRLAPLPPSALSAPTSCPVPPGPERPQVPVPVPSTPPPVWRGRVLAQTTGRWYVPQDAFRLAIGADIGAADGYGTWLQAVTAAGELSLGAGIAVAVMDHMGRLYLRALEIADHPAYLPAEPYRIGARNETGVTFTDDAMRGIVDGDRRMGRGDCLDPWVAVPVPKP